MVVMADVVERHHSIAEDRLQVVVFKTGEIEPLEWIQVHRLGYHTEFHRLEVMRTFCDYHDVSPVLAAKRFTKSACRQQFVVDDKAVVIHQQDVYSRFDVPVLEGVVEQNDIDVILCLAFGKLADAMTAVAVNSHRDIVAILALHLQRFVTHGSCRRLVVGNDEASCVTLVATTENSHLHLVFQQTYQVFHMRSLAGAAHSDVAHRDDRHVKTLALQYADLKQHIAELHSQAVKPAEREQPFVYLDKVAFCPHLVEPVLLYNKVYRHSCLNGILLVEFLHEHERSIVFAQSRTEFAVEVVVALR